MNSEVKPYIEHFLDIDQISTVFFGRSQISLLEQSWGYTHDLSKSELDAGRGINSAIDLLDLVHQNCYGQPIDLNVLATRQPEDEWQQEIMLLYDLKGAVNLMAWRLLQDSSLPEDIRREFNVRQNQVEAHLSVSALTGNLRKARDWYKNENLLEENFIPSKPLIDSLKSIIEKRKRLTEYYNTDSELITHLGNKREELDNRYCLDLAEARLGVFGNLIGILGLPEDAYKEYAEMVGYDEGMIEVWRSLWT